MPKKRGKRYVEAREKTPEGRLSLDEAVTALKQLPSGKFDSTIELSMHLGIDPRQADQALRGSVSLPHGIGKTRKVIAFCEGEDVDKAKAAGAIEAGSDELVQKIQDGWTDFDVAISTPQMMKNVSRLGRVLGPQGKMPSPKSGTIVQDNIDEAVKEFAAGKVEYRNDSGGNLHVPIGKWSFSEEQIRENAASFIRMVKRLRPTTTKGTYIKKICISGTMTPSVEIDAMSVST
jgi:large subunit ribosomal protein L1